MKISHTSLLLAAALAIGAAGCSTDLTTDATEQGHYYHGQDPVVFVHGCWPGPPLGTEPFVNEHAVLWPFAFIPAFQQMGYADEDLNVWVYEGAVCGDIIDMARSLSEFVDNVRAQTGAWKVDLVAHSTAGLTVRTYIKWFGGDYRVDDVAILAGSNHGTDLLYGLAEQWQQQFGYPAYQAALQMEGSYACYGESADNLQYYLNGCLTDTGRTKWRDETPGRYVDYLNLYLTNDEINQPNDSSCLNQDFKGDCSDSVNVPVDWVQPAPDGSAPAHVMIAMDPQVIGMVYDHLQDGWGYDD